MKALLLFTAAAGTATLLATPAQSQSAGAGGARCYIELQKLMAEQSGIADLGTAMRQLDAKLRPQVEEVRRLQHLVEALELEQQQAMLAASASVDGESVSSVRPVATPIATVNGEADAGELGRATLDLRTANEELQIKRAQLRADYDRHLSAIVGPVQAQVGQRAMAYGTQRGCANLKVARSGDLGSLRSAGARDLTPEFVSWYGQSRR